VIPDEVVEQVQDAADIVAIVGEHVKLKRVGSSWRGPCPFHHGKGDNFSVLPGKGYRCFVCGETGSVFSFVQKHLGMDFVEAVKLVGARSGIVVEEVQRRTEGPDPRAPHWEVLGATAAYFERLLWEEDEGEAARRYLVQRGITRELAERFGLGVAPRPIGAMRRYLEVLGFDAPRQLEAGVLIQREGEAEPRPRFRGRLMFPIHDPRGNVVGFGGRAIDGGEPKYLNSGESAVFHKGQLLYHLHAARHAIRKAERVLVVEGYVDVLRLVAAGVEEVVAPLGTALTLEQAALLRRYTANVFLLYDSDQAGLKATFRSGDVLLREGAAVRVVTLPDGEDPDTFVAKYGAEGLERELRASVDVFDRKVQLLQRGGWFADLHKARKAIDRLLPTIRAASDPLTRELYVARAAQAAGVDKETLLREAAALPDPFEEPTPRPGPAAPVAAPEAAPRRGRRPALRVGAEAERALVRVMLLYRGRVDDLTEQLGRVEDEALAEHGDAPDPLPPAGLRDPALQAIHGALLEVGSEAELSALAEALPAEAVPVLEALVSEPEGILDVAATVDDALDRLRARWREERIARLTAALAGAGSDAQRAASLEVLRLKREAVALRTGAPRGSRG
jgi:DNA primase